MKVRAAVAREGVGRFNIETVDLDSPRSDEILVGVVGVGLCHTDVASLQGGMVELPAILGHEASGIVEEVGADVTKVKPGDHVAVTFRSCGNCIKCNSGNPAYCLTFTTLNLSGCRTDGSTSVRVNGHELSSNFFGQSSFATHCLAYETNVVKIPEDFPLEFAGPLGCGIQTGAGATMRSLACREGASLLIVGGGSVGLSALMGAVLQKCGTVILVERLSSRRALAEELGATHVIDPSQSSNLVETVRNIVPDGVDYAVDTTGQFELLETALRCLGPQGTLGIVALSPPDTPIPGNLMTLMTYGHTIKGIIEGDSEPDVFIPELIRLNQAGEFPFDKLIRTYPLSQINEAIEAQHKGECVKVVLLPDPT